MAAQLFDWLESLFQFLSLFEQIQCKAIMWESYCVFVSMLTVQNTTYYPSPVLSAVTIGRHDNLFVI